MLKFLFNRNSKMVAFMEAAGLLLTSGWAYSLSQTPGETVTKIGLALFLFEYLFLKFCAAIHWHKEAKRWEGIELQFKKGLIPTAYLMTVTSLIGFTTGSTILLWVAVLFTAVVAHVNVILLYLHYKDKNKTPINYFSGNKFKA